MRYTKFVGALDPDCGRAGCRTLSVAGRENQDPVVSFSDRYGQEARFALPRDVASNVHGREY